MSLTHLHARLSAIHDSIRSFDVPPPQLPIISHDKDNTEALPGLRFLREEVKRDYDTLDRFLRESASSPAPSTNAPYLIAVWDELVHARQPVAIHRTFSPANGQDKTRRKGTTPQDKSQPRPVKVDVVSENGARWVRVNTIKNARLGMEFREIDSYLTSDEDEDEPRPRLAQIELDNSVVRMGRELLTAAKVNPVLIPAPLIDSVPDWSSATPHSTAILTPQITIRFTRLDPSTADEPRVGKTIQCLRDMGIDVQLGEQLHSDSTPILKTPTKFKLLAPTTSINLDLSALIALISDISHSPLPRTEKEAYDRFSPPRSYLGWKKDRARSLACQSQSTQRSLQDMEDGDGNEATWENPRQQSCALAAQTIQEMSKGLLEEIHEHISMVVTQRSADMTFWTTDEARHRCLQIVSKIGGKRERQRTDALLGSALCASIPPIPAPGHIYTNGITTTNGMLEATPGVDNVEWRTLDACWGPSRYSAGLLPVVPVRVYPSILPGGEHRQPRTTFFDALMRTCTRILSYEAASVSYVSAASDPLSTTEETLGEIPPATKTLCPKLTKHTITSMLAGASRGHTTLTTNRSSVKAVLKEMRKVYGRGGYEPEVGDIERAALWVVDPRSLSERVWSE